MRTLRDRHASVICVALIAVAVLSAACTKYKATNETRIGTYVSQFCMQHSEECNGGSLMVVNPRAGILTIHGPELYVREIKCSPGYNDSLDVTAHITNVGDVDAVLKADVPVTATAYTLGGGTLQPLGTGQDTLRATTTIPVYVAGGTDSTVDMYIPTSALRRGVNQIMVQIDPSYLQVIGGSYEYIYWPGGKFPEEVSSAGLDLTNPNCTVSVTPGT